MYLGSVLNDNNVRQPEISERICKGNRAYYANAKTFKIKIVKEKYKYENVFKPY
jgi:hypothetical protein